jgi:hypothetical protein
MLRTQASGSTDTQLGILVQGIDGWPQDITRYSVHAELYANLAK